MSAPTIPAVPVRQARRTALPVGAGTLVLTAEAPWHRLERGRPEPGGVPLLGALAPDRGWPRWIVRVPMRWRGGACYERLPQALSFERFDPPAQGQPGDPWRFTLPVEAFPDLPLTPTATATQLSAASTTESAIDQSAVDQPVMDQPGLLILAAYPEPRAVAMEGGHHGRWNEGLAGEDLWDQMEAAVDQLLGLAAHRWWQGFVPHPATPAPTSLCFALAACQYPPGLLDVSPGGELDAAQASPALASMTRLHHLARSTPLGQELSLLLLAGDQIYADASGGLADSVSGVERYARAYGEFKSGPVRHLPPTVARIVHSVDDHEIIDNWEPRSDGRGPWFDAARQAAWDHRWEAGDRTGGPRCLWHDFDWCGAAFFVADARCEREARRVSNWSTARLWSHAQRDAFAEWLRASAGRPRFVMSGSLPLPRRRSTAEHPASALRSDAWDGYPHSLHELLGEIWLQRAQGLVLLSGDEHRSGWVTAEIAPVAAPGLADAVDAVDVEHPTRGVSEREQTVRVHSIHSSALYAPWPFAVTAAEELAAPEVFEFDGPGGQRLRCTVSGWSDHPGDGFAVIRVADGQLQLWFDRAGVPFDQPAAVLSV